MSRTKNRRNGHGVRGFVYAVCVVLAFAAVAQGQSRNTEHTLKLDDPSNQPPASLDDISWMIGSWAGEAFGGKVEEDWMPPSAGTITGVFKLMHENRPSMYEFFILVEDNDSLAIRLRHFNSDFSSWEDKSEFVSFPLVKLTEDAAYFDGLTYRRLDEDRLVVHVSVGEEHEEHELNFVRKAAAELRSPTQSPYAGLETRSIKALSAEQIASLRAGEGMGMAMAAELNGYPGPKHVLELRQELKMSPDQIAATTGVFDAMHASASALGERIVAAERNLDGLFARHEISREALEAAALEIAALRGELRAVHLGAHLEMIEILSAEQRHTYVTRRGYSGDSMPGHHPGMHGDHGK